MSHILFHAKKITLDTDGDTHNNTLRTNSYGKSFLNSHTVVHPGTPKHLIIITYIILQKRN